MNNENYPYPTEDLGTVIEVEGEKIRVEVVRSANCKTCSMQSFCFGLNKPAVFEVESELELKPGDKVELEIAPASRIISSLLIFGLPILCLFLGYFIGNIWLEELPSICIALAATAFSYIILKIIDRKLEKRYRFVLEENYDY